MPSLYVSADNADGYVSSTSTSNWTSARDATSGNASHNDASSSYAIRERNYAGRGGGTQRVVFRSFFTFDTSGITSAPSEAILKIRGNINGTCDFFAVKSTHSVPIVDVDLDAITGWSSGADNEGNVTKYSAEITSWSTSGYNDITLTEDARDDMASLSTFKVCLIGSIYDLRNVEPTANYDASSGVHYKDAVGTDKDPYIDYTVAVAVVDDAVFFGANF